MNPGLLGEKRKRYLCAMPSPPSLKIIACPLTESSKAWIRTCSDVEDEPDACHDATDQDQELDPEQHSVGYHLGGTNMDMYSGSIDAHQPGPKQQEHLAWVGQPLLMRFPKVYNSIAQSGSQHLQLKALAAP